MKANLKWFSSTKVWLGGSVAVVGVGSYYAAHNLFHHHYSAEHYIKHYQKEYYSHLSLSEPLCQQLSWLQKNSVTTSQSSVRRLRSEFRSSLNFEIQRSFLRLANLQLLENGDDTAYLRFVVSQLDPELRLTKTQFSELSNQIKNLSADELASVRVSAVFTLSDKARERVEAKTGRQFPLDSERFLTALAADSELLELCPIFLMLNKNSRNLMRSLYPLDCHLRHMLYMEGGNEMFDTLRNGIKQGTLTKEAYALWWCRWIVNIAGFTFPGTAPPYGAYYMTRSVADTLGLLKQELDRLWLDPDYDVLTGYLQARAKNLEVNNLFVARLCCLMGCYSKKEARRVQTWFDGLTNSKQKEYANCLAEARRVTYRPALLGNLLALKGITEEEALFLYMEIERAGKIACLNQTGKEAMPGAAPLSLRSLGESAVATDLWNFYKENNALPIFYISETGELKVVCREKELIPTPPVPCVP